MVLRQPVFQSGPSAGINQTLSVFFQPAEGDSLPICASSHLLRAYYVRAMLGVKRGPVPAHSAAGTQQPARAGPTGYPVLQLMTNRPSLRLPRVRPSSRSPPTPVTASVRVPRRPSVSVPCSEPVLCCRAVYQPHFSRPASPCPVPSLIPIAGPIPDKPSGTWAKNTGSGLG